MNLNQCKESVCGIYEKYLVHALLKKPSQEVISHTTAAEVHHRLSNESQSTEQADNETVDSSSGTKE